MKMYWNERVDGYENVKIYSNYECTLNYEAFEHNSLSMNQLEWNVKFVIL